MALSNRTFAAEQVAKDNATGYSVVNNLTVRTP
jgi:hypothetical protein